MYPDSNLVFYTFHFRKMLKRSKSTHDLIYYNIDFNHSKFVEYQHYKLNEKPFFFTHRNVSIKQNQMAKEFAYYNASFENLAKNSTHTAPVTDLSICKSTFFLRRRIQTLCQDKVRYVKTVHLNMI